jgi:molybdopterin synthase sulfur carrier subunit
MVRIVFTQNLQRHVACPETEVRGRSVGEVLEAVFAENPQARSYVLDDQAALRKHITVFVDGKMIRDRVRLSDVVGENSRIHVLQALSGG